MPAVQHVNAGIARDAPRVGDGTVRMVSVYGDDAERALSHAFLRLFYGGGGAAHVVRDRLKAAGRHHDAKFTAEKYMKHLTRMYDGGRRRFQRDHQFLFYSFDAGKRREICQVTARITKDDNFETAVVRDLADACRRDAWSEATAGGAARRVGQNVTDAGRRFIRRVGFHLLERETRFADVDRERSKRRVGDDPVASMRQARAVRHG